MILRNLTLGIGDGWLKADGETIYTAKDLRVGLFQAGKPQPAGCMTLYRAKRLKAS